MSCYSKVIFTSLFDAKLDILNQLLNLNLMKNGYMMYAIRDIIDFKNGKIFNKYKINQLKQSIIAYIKDENKVISWCLLAKDSKNNLKWLSKIDGVKWDNFTHEMHLFTHKKYRKKGLATKIVKSIKRKYPGIKYFCYYNESSIFVKQRVLRLRELEDECSIRRKPSTIKSNIS